MDNISFVLEKVEPGQIDHKMMPAGTLMQPDEDGDWYDAMYEPKFTKDGDVETKRAELLASFQKLAGKSNSDSLILLGLIWVFNSRCGRSGSPHNLRGAC